MTDWKIGHILNVKINKKKFVKGGKNRRKKN